MNEEMENRREYYRHAIPPTPGVMVLFRSTDGAQSFFGEMVNLSIGGLCVHSVPPELAVEMTWLASFALMPDAVPICVPVQRVYASEGRPGCVGFQFLPRALPLEQENQDRQIWSFLLDQQRGDWRKARTSKRRSTA